jgi:hypothetical protein
MENYTPRITALNAAFAREGFADLNQYHVRSAERRSSLQNFPVGRNSVAVHAFSLMHEKNVHLRQNQHQYAFASFAKRLSRLLAKTLNFALGNVQPLAKIAPPISDHIISRILKNTFGRISKKSLVKSEDVDCVLSVKRIWASEPVYDLSVAQGHLPEFFANGILTHNSSEGEIEVYDDTIGAYQERLIRPKLESVINFQQLSLFGDIDPEITWRFAPLRPMTEAEKGEKQAKDADRDTKFIDGGVLRPEEVRKRIADDPDMPYADIDPDDVPDLAAEESEGLEPQGGRPDPKAEGEPDKSEPGAEK